MNRRSSIAMLLAIPVCLLAAPLLAQDAWPSFPSGRDPHELQRGPGFYLAIYKLVLMTSLAWLWMFTADWINSDTELHGEKTGLKRDVWNPIFVFTFLGVFIILGLSIPIFFIGFLLSMLAYGVPLGIYVFQRNKKVGPEDRVFTPDHIKRWISTLGKKKAEPEKKKAPHEYGAPVEFVPLGGKDQENQANLITARQSPHFVPAKELIADALNSRATKILLDYTAEGVTAKYTVDGNWLPANPKVHEKEPFNREMGDGILAVLKKVAGMNPADRRSKQEGKLRIEYQGGKQSTSVTSQGTPTGERVLIGFVPIIKNPPTLEELGMRDKHRDMLKGILAKKADLVVFASMPGDGLSATWVAMLKSADRFTRDFVTIEDVNKREGEVENIEIVKYDGSSGETPMSKMAGVLLKQPEVLMIPEIADGEALKVLLASCIDDEKKAIVSLRAKEAPEAILRLLMLKPPADQLAQCISAVINQRLIRKLCEDCKEAYQPEPAFLKKLGIPEGKVQALYREKQPPPPGQEPPKKKKGEPEICPKCRGIGYFGRTAIYEIMVIDDAIRQAIVAQPKIEVLKQLSKKAGNWSLQEEGILLLAQGITSLQELQRVLKQ